jgi:hypothetical protein
MLHVFLLRFLEMLHVLSYEVYEVSKDAEVSEFLEILHFLSSEVSSDAARPFF